MFHVLIGQHHLLLKAASPDGVATVARILKHVLLNGATSVPAGYLLKGVVCVFGQAEEQEAGKMVVEKIHEAAQTLNLVTEMHQGMEKLKALISTRHPDPLPDRGGEGGASGEADRPASDEEARRLFALLRALELETNFRKAPVTRVFLLYCLDGKSRKAVARACRCSPSLVTLRLKVIEQKLGRKAGELRPISGHFERIADSLRDDRARRIDRRQAADGMREDDDFS